MTNVIIFSNNVKFSAFEKLSKFIKLNDASFLFLSTHYLFEYEKNTIKNIFNNSTFMVFADYLLDADCEEIDRKAYSIETEDCLKYCEVIKKIKNEKVCERLLLGLKEYNGYILSEDLGIDRTVWESKGFTYLKVEHYYENSISLLRKCLRRLKPLKSLVLKFRELTRIKKLNIRVYSADFQGRKLIFIGKINRVEMHLNIPFTEDSEEAGKVIRGNFKSSDRVQYLMAMHESGTVLIPDSPKYDIRFVQDGYLPPNYTAQNLRFKPNNVKYYALDKIGKDAFEAQHVSVELLPFRRNTLLPKPDFSKQIKTILITATCAGPWSSLINPSDDDILLEAIVESAKRYPDITFVYRPHPACVHPMHTGVNTINRIAEYFDTMKLQNLKLSTNVPHQNMKAFSLSFSNTSLLEDIKGADLILSEYSHSLIEGAEVGKIFVTVNLTKRRNFYEAITNLGFPHCNSIDELWSVIENIHSPIFISQYKKAIDNYNAMLDMEE